MSPAGERTPVRGTKPSDVQQWHHEAMQRYTRNMIMEGISQNSMSEGIQAASAKALVDMNNEARLWHSVPGRDIKWSKLTSIERKHIKSILKKPKVI